LTGIDYLTYRKHGSFRGLSLLVCVCARFKPLILAGRGRFDTMSKIEVEQELSGVKEVYPRPLPPDE
jgi:hypothetical protein